MTAKTAAGEEAGTPGGVVTIFLEVPDARAAMKRIDDVLDARGLIRRLTIGHGSSDRSV